MGGRQNRNSYATAFYCLILIYGVFGEFSCLLLPTLRWGKARHRNVTLEMLFLLLQKWDPQLFGEKPSAHSISLLYLDKCARLPSQLLYAILNRNLGEFRGDDRDYSECHTCLGCQFFLQQEHVLTVLMMLQWIWEFLVGQEV